jgi:hypothetical protein
MNTITVADWVIYILDDTDAAKINAWRANFQRSNTLHADHKHPHQPGAPGATGHIAHTGPSVHPGDELPALVMHINEEQRLSLKVMLIGSDTHQVDGVAEGHVPGTWHFKARVA